MTFAFADPREWVLEITPAIQTQYWQQSQTYTTPSSRWRAYINQICVYAFSDWTSHLDSIQAIVWCSFPGTPAFWEFVNGTVVLLEERRIVLIPSEAIDDSELEVPQEWVDIPSWAADYYLAVQVNASGDWVRFWGYTTYQNLKSKGNYDFIDRTYCLDARHLTKDFNAFWVNYQFCKQEPSILTKPTLSELSTATAENLLQRLTHNAVTFHRLAVPFTTWGALLENEQWRQQLYQRLKQSRYLNLSRWLEGVYDQLWDSVEAILGENVGETAFKFRESLEVEARNVKRAKLINLGKDGSTSFVLVIAITWENSQQACIRVQLHPKPDNLCLPKNVKLALQVSGETIQEVQAREQDNYIQLNRFEGEVGETFSIQVKIENYQILENFVI
jgi:Protein of unknown function (DUF1822)